MLCVTQLPTSVKPQQEASKAEALGLDLKHKVKKVEIRRATEEIQSFLFTMRGE